MSFVEWKIRDKQLYLNTHYPLVGIPKLTDRRFCIHCEQWFTVGDYRVQLEYGFSGKKVKYIVCPNAPECDGTLLDWWDHDFEGNKDNCSSSAGVQLEPEATDQPMERCRLNPSLSGVPERRE